MLQRSRHLIPGRATAASAVAALIALSQLASAPPAQADPPAPMTGLATQAAMTGEGQARARLVTLLHNRIHDLSTRTGPADMHWYADGVWTAPPAVTEVWRYLMGPAVAAAELSAATESSGAAPMREMAIRTVDITIARYRASNGSFGLSMTTGNEVDTMFVASQIAQAFLSLETYLTQERRLRWTSAVTDAADYLITNGNLKWYTNGNINVGNATVMAGAYAMSRQQKYADYTAQAIDFAMNPSQNRWPGLGFRYTTIPVRLDGADGAGYFVETGAGGPGYDSDYTQLQADLSARLYELTGDKRVLRVLNMLVNQLLVRTDRTTWHLDISGGSRHSARDWRYLTTSALSVVAWQGGRADLRVAAASQLTAIETNFNQAFLYDGPNAWGGLASQPAISLRAARRAPFPVTLPARTPTSVPVVGAPGPRTSPAPATPPVAPVQLDPTIVGTVTTPSSPAPERSLAPTTRPGELWYWVGGSPVIDGEQLIIKGVIRNVSIASGVSITLQRKRGVGWVPISSGVSDVNGQVKFVLTPHAAETYRVVNTPSGSLPGFTGAAAYVPVLPKVVIVNGKVSVLGRVNPARTGVVVTLSRGRSIVARTKSDRAGRYLVAVRGLPAAQLQVKIGRTTQSLSATLDAMRQRG